MSTCPIGFQGPINWFDGFLPKIGFVWERFLTIFCVIQLSFGWMLKVDFFSRIISISLEAHDVQRIASRNSFLHLFYIQRNLPMVSWKSRLNYQQLIKFMKDVVFLFEWFYRIFSVWLIRIELVVYKRKKRKQSNFKCLRDVAIFYSKFWPFLSSFSKGDYCSLELEMPRQKNDPIIFEKHDQPF